MTLTAPDTPPTPAATRSAPLRILGVMPVYCHPDWRGSGVARAATDILMELARRGNHVTVLSPAIDGDRTFDIPDRAAFVEGRFQLRYSTKARNTRFGTTAGGLAPLMREFTSQVDVVDIHSFMSPWTDRGAAIARAAGVPYAIHDHGKLTPSILANRAFSKRVYLMLKGRRALRGALRVFSCADALTGAISAWDPKIRCLTCSNALPAHEFDGPAPARPIAEPYVLFFGWLDPRKNPDLLIRAFAKVAADAPEWTLAMVGPDSYGQGAKLQDLARELGVGQRVVFPGMASGEAKMAWLRNAGVYALPSTGEGLSMAMLEALACGLPSLLSPGCNLPEIKAAGAGEEIPLDDDAWARALLSYMRDDDLRRRSGESARRMFLERFTLDVVGEKLERDLREALAQWNSGRLSAGRP